MDRAEFFPKLLNMVVSSDEMLSVSYAYWIAKRVHEEQNRDDGERYFEHCRHVALILMEEFAPATVKEIILALLHDCIEDGFIPLGFLEKLFEKEVVNGLEIVSKKTPIFDEFFWIIDKPRKDTAEYFRAIREAPSWVRRVKLADRLHNLRSMREVWELERQERYLLETKTYLVGIAEQTDERFAKELARQLGDGGSR